MTTEEELERVKRERDDYEQARTALEEALGQEMAEKKAERERADALAARNERLANALSVIGKKGKGTSPEGRVARTAISEEANEILAARDLKMKALALSTFSLTMEIEAEASSAEGSAEIAEDRLSYAEKLHGTANEYRRQAGEAVGVMPTAPAPEDSLASRDALIKAEARRDEVESIISVIDAYPDRCSLITMLRERSAELRRKAEGGEHE